MPDRTDALLEQLIDEVRALHATTIALVTKDTTDAAERFADDVVDDVREARERREELAT